jgi:hypothetical protein
VRLDDDVRGGVGVAGEHPAVGDLAVVEVALVGLVHGAGDDLAGARGAGPRAAGVGQVDAVLLGLVQDVHVVGHLQLHLPLRRDQLHVVGGLRAQPAPAAGATAHDAHLGRRQRHGGRRRRGAEGGRRKEEGRRAGAAQDGGHCCGGSGRGGVAAGAVRGLDGESGAGESGCWINGQ